MYVINAILVPDEVVRQIREHSLDLRALAVPVLAVGAAAVMFLHSVPGGGNDIALELLGVSAGAAMGAVGGLATRGYQILGPYPCDKSFFKYCKSDVANSKTAGTDLCRPPRLALLRL